MMPRESARPRKRKFYSSDFVKNAKKNRVSDEDNTDGEPSTPSDDFSASASQISERNSTVAEGGVEGQLSKVTRYRFVDVQ